MGVIRTVALLFVDPESEGDYDVEADEQGANQPVARASDQEERHGHDSHDEGCYKLF